MGSNNVVTLQQQSGAVVDIDTLGGSALEMSRSLDEMKAKIEIVQRFIKDVMIEGLDYGKIPYTDNRTLFQPGADKLNALYGYARQIVFKDENKNDKTGHYDVTIRIKLCHKGTGIVVGEGEGSCSTMESKYRYRWVYESKLPRGIDKESLVTEIFKSKKKGEEGKEYAKYRIENADLADVWNTVLKMAIKRAYLSATLAATGLSGIFSQEEEDFDSWVDGDGNDKPEKEKFEKQRATPKASDERSSFTPPTGNKLSDKQYGKIVGDAKRKNVDESGIKSIVQFVKGKSLSDLTTAEASSVIDFIAKTNEEELQDLLMSAALPGDMA